MAAPRILRAIAVVSLALAGVAAPTAALADSDDRDVNAFSYSSWDARYEVRQDDDGRARMHVTETLVAAFPDADQNKGIVRGLATTYEGAFLETTVLGVTDESGEAVPYETDQDDGVLYVLTGDDDYVRGPTTYVIEYEMRDVIRDVAPSDNAPEGVDEFYWDLLPLDSTQPIDEFHAEIVLAPPLSEHLTGASRCYIGVQGSKDECDVAGPVAATDGAVFRVAESGLAAGEGVTVAVGFAPGTVTQPPARMPNPVTDVVPIGAAVGAVGLSAAAWVAVSVFQSRRRRATGIIVAQYDVPDDLPPLLAAALIPGAKDVIPAEIVHLAVRSVLRIEEGEHAEEPRLRLGDRDAAPDPLDRKALDALFTGAGPEGLAALPSADEAFATRMAGLAQSGTEAASERGLTTTARSRGAAIVMVCAIVVAIAGLALGVWGAIEGRLSAMPALLAISVGALAVIVSCFYVFSAHTVLTAEGAQRSEYLQGVAEFIRVAEADRLRMLQSYSGAERRPDGTADVIHVYERLLPYAMLFGMEKEWGDVLDSTYAREQRSPGWIGDGATPYLGATLAAFTASSNAAVSYSAPSTASSSSTGGSFGGGFSGGGGGGGFSGGR